jgi:hypothetical protein
LKGKIGGQSNMITSSRRQYPPSTPNHFPCHSHTLQVRRRHKSPFFQKTIYKTKNLTLDNVVISTTIHNRGRGYSNSFTLCRGYTLYPHHSINPPGYHHGPSYISMRGSNNRSKPPSISLSTGAYPVEFTSPARPGSTSSRA